MISMMKLSTPEVVGVVINGQVSKLDIERIASVISEKIIQFKRINLLININTLSRITPSAILKDLQQAIVPRNQIAKVALISESDILNQLTEAGNIFGAAEIKSYQPTQKEAALNWVQSGYMMKPA